MGLEQTSNLFTTKFSSNHQKVFILLKELFSINKQLSLTTYNLSTNKPYTHSTINKFLGLSLHHNLNPKGSFSALNQTPSLTFLLNRKVYNLQTKPTDGLKTSNIFGTKKGSLYLPKFL